MRKKLPPNQERFIEEYLIDLNATQAAIRAGYSPKTANEQGARLLANASVRHKIDALKQARSERTEITADVVLKELLRLARVDISQAFDERGWLKDLKDIPEDVRRAISGIETQELFSGDSDQKSIIGVTRKVKFWDKTKALELLGKHLKLFTDKLEHSGNVTLEEIVAGSRGEK